MTNHEVVMLYLERFCAVDIEGLQPLLAPNLKFDGTFHRYHSRSEYIEDLRKNPPEKSSYKVLSMTENADSVAVFYDYRKQKKTIKLAQLFKVKDHKILEVLLIFDGRGFD